MYHLYVSARARRRCSTPCMRALFPHRLSWRLADSNIVMPALPRATNNTNNNTRATALWRHSKPNAANLAPANGRDANISTRYRARSLAGAAHHCHIVGIRELNRCERFFRPRRRRHGEHGRTLSSFCPRQFSGLNHAKALLCSPNPFLCLARLPLHFRNSLFCAPPRLLHRQRRRRRSNNSHCSGRECPKLKQGHDATNFCFCDDCDVLLRGYFVQHDIGRCTNVMHTLILKKKLAASHINSHKPHDSVFYASTLDPASSSRFRFLDASSSEIWILRQKKLTLVHSLSTLPTRIGQSIFCESVCTSTQSSTQPKRDELAHQLADFQIIESGS